MVIIFEKTNKMIKKMTILAILLILSILPIFGKDNDKKKTETVETVVKTPVETKSHKDSEKFKEDMRESVLEFIGDLKINPDTCYVPFKK
jgi:hypothetical protein